MPTRSSAYGSLLSLALLTLSCGGDDLTLPNQGQPATVVAAHGDDQNGTVGEELAESLVVLVQDRFENPVPNVTVVWSAEGGGSVDPAESVTDKNGHASTARVLGSEPSTYFTLASVEGITKKAQFLSTGLAARLVITSQVPAIAVSGEPLSPQPQLRLEELDGTPIAREGVDVTVAISTGGGTLDGTTSATSDADGVVTFTDLAIRGSPGTHRLIFAAVSFAPAVTPPIALGVGAPASIEGLTGDDQEATAGEAVPVDPAVVVRDEDGNPLGGIPVTFTVTAGGGAVDGNVPVTDANGVATVGEWRLGPAAGENTLSAAVGNLDLEGSPVVFSATGTAGGVSAEASTVSASPANITASTGSSASTITVTVRDQFGNPLEGIDVVLSVDGNGNDLVQPTEPTGANGVATGRLSSTAVGTRTVSATAGGVALEATASVTIAAGAPVAANSQATVPNGTSGSTTRIELLLRDAFNNPASGRASSVQVSVSGANNVGALPITDDGQGRYSATYSPVVAGADQVDVRVGGAPVAGSPFTSSVAPGPASAAASTAVVTWNFFTVDAVITARDAQGNPVGRGGDAVVVTPSGFGATAATDQGNGTYTASIAVFSFPVVSITLNGAAIQGSPFSP